nr:transposase [Rhizobium leguminosarum]
MERWPFAACLEPGVSVSRLALEHGINANLLRKWIKKAKEDRPVPPSSTSAFVPVQVTMDRSLPMQSSALDRPPTRGEERPSKSQRMGPLAVRANVNASLPNGVNLSLECCDMDALAAIIGALVMFRLGADIKVYLHREPIDFRADRSCPGRWCRS